jgi:hypothetical protein
MFTFGVENTQDNRVSHPPQGGKFSDTGELSAFITNIGIPEL